MNEEEEEGNGSYEEVGEIDDGPCDARWAAEEGEDGDPGEEDEEYVRRPHAPVHHPLRVPVQHRRGWRLRVELRHFSLLSL